MSFVGDKEHSDSSPAENSSNIKISLICPIYGDSFCLSGSGSANPLKLIITINIFNNKNEPGSAYNKRLSATESVRYVNEF
jgi:hypothetical protein